MTHDLCKSHHRRRRARRSVASQITRVESNTYFAELHLERDGRLVHVDSRPSDAIAIAVRLDAPIFAADVLLDRPGRGRQRTTPRSQPRRPSPRRDARELSAEKLKEYLEHLRPEDFGKFNL